MKLWAVSDLHVGPSKGRDRLAQIPSHPEDWLALVGDIGESQDDLRYVLGELAPRFRQLIWVPGNHELWTLPGRDTLRGEAKYQALVDMCREQRVLTPEDPYQVFEGEQGPLWVVPMFTLYDYSFSPPGSTPLEAVAWARQAGVDAMDEVLLHPDPYPSRQQWCIERCQRTELRITETIKQHNLPTVLINHFPLSEELAVLPRVPRFKVWCGTHRTSDWPRQFRAAAVVFGHLHIPQKRILNGVPHYEVSLGWWPNPRAKLHRVLPGHNIQ